MQSGGTSTTLTSIARRSAPSETEMLTSVSPVAAIARKAPSRSESRNVAPVPGDRALLREAGELGNRLGRDQLDLAVAEQQALDLLQPDVAPADDQAAPPLELQARHI